MCTSWFAYWEIKGRFRKRVVLANVPSFRGEHENVPSFRFSFWGNIRMYPRSGFRSGGTSAKTTLLETFFLSTPENWNFEKNKRKTVNIVPVHAPIRGGCMYGETPHGRKFVTPLFYAPPSPMRAFQGWLSVFLPHLPVSKISAFLSCVTWLKLNKFYENSLNLTEID